MDLFPATPNLDVLLSRNVVVKVLRAAGGLQGLSLLNGMKIRLLGIEEKKAEATAAVFGGSSVASSSTLGSLAQVAEKVIGGYIIESALLDALFEGDLVNAVGTEPLVVRKAVDILGNKCALAAKADLAVTRRDGGYGQELAEEIRAAVKLAKEKGKVDAGHVKALDAVQTREDKKKQRGGKQARSEAKREREEAEEGLDAVTIVLNQYLSQVSEVDLNLTREEREERLLKREDVRRAILVKKIQMEKEKEQKRQQKVQQNIDFVAGASFTSSVGGSAESFFAASSGYLASEFGSCLVRYEEESAMYGHVAAVMR